MRLDIEYDGRAFKGWAKQPGERTVEGELETALSTVLGRPVELTVAGRTDAGVHARAQVASFIVEDQPPSTFRRSLNGLTGRDLSIIEASVVDDGFDARRSARSRTYCYRLYTRAVANPFEQGRSLWWPWRLDLDLLRACAAATLGTHDFTAFTPTQTDHVHFHRTVIRCEWVQDADETLLWIEANSFMRSMVRALAGTMLEVATGKRELESYLRLLAGQPRAEAGDTAAAHGLYLVAVAY